MNAVVPTAARAQLSHTDPRASIRDWVDALAREECDSAQFLRHLRELGRDNAEPIWEALALLDQAFRSKRINRDLFLPIKVNLQQYALRRGESAVADGAAPAAPSASRIPVCEPIGSTRAAGATGTPAAKSTPAAAAAAPAAEPIRVGSVLRGRYRIIGLLGKGDIGRVVEAIDEMRADVPDVQQRIAIRILDSPRLQDSGAMAACLRHVCKLQTLSHPNLLRIFDFDQDQGRPFLTMELLSGFSLPQVLTQGDSALRFRLDRLHVLRCVAGALLCAHAQGLAHGELRAEKVFVTLAGEVRLTGLYEAFDKTADDIPKDHLAFAWLARDLLAGGSNPEQLRRPEGLGDKQWRALEAVIIGRESEGARLLQLFAEPARAGSGEEMYTVSYAPPSGDSARRGRAKWLRGALLACLAGGLAYLAFDRRDDLQTYLQRFAGSSTAPASGTANAAAAPAAGAAASNAPQNASSEPSPPESPPPNAAVSTTTATASTAANRPAAGAPVAPASRYSLINLAQAALQVEDSNTVARIRVVRQGNLASRVEFLWWTENGSAEPGVDFFAVTPRGAHFPANAASVELFVPLVPAAMHTRPVTFYVKIDVAGAGASLGQRTLAQVSIVPPGYVAPPAAEDADLLRSGPGTGP